MASFIITSYDNSFEISKDGHTKEFQKGVLSYDDDPNNDQILDINTTQSRQQLYRIDLDKDTLNIDGTTTFADSEAIKTALRTFFFRNVGGSTPGGGGPIYENFLVIAENGDDGTGTRNDTSKPYATILAAYNDSIDGDTIVFYPGTYSIGSNIIRKSISLVAPFGEVTINSGGSSSSINDSLGAINFKMIGNFRWISTFGPFLPSSNTGLGVWDFQNSSSEIEIDVEYCENFRIRLWNLIGSSFTIRKSNLFYIAPENCTNTQIRLGDATNFGFVEDLNSYNGPNTGVVVAAIGGRAKLTKDNINLGATTGRHRSVIYFGNGFSGIAPATWVSDVEFKNFDIDSSRNTVNISAHMQNYTFDNCLIESDRSSGNGRIVIVGGAALGGKPTFRNCRWRSLVGGSPGIWMIADTNGSPTVRFIGTNVIQVTSANSLEALDLSGGTFPIDYDLIGELIVNSAPSGGIINNITGTSILVDANVTVK